jgi:hypothetical protein
MNRNDFLTTILLGSTLLLTRKKAGAAPAPAITQVRLCSPYIAGYMYYDGEDAEDLMQEGEMLFLEREPRNKYDRFAIAVYYRDAKLGYLPRYENRSVARIMDQGVKVNSVIVKVNREDDPFTRVRIKVYYETEAGNVQTRTNS